MHDTGRLHKTLDWRARQIVFGNCVDRAIDEELHFAVQIDRAHVVMLVECGLLERAAGQRLLAAIDALVSQDYAPLRGRSAPRGWYLLYEQWLIETLGEQVGGAAHLGRSRNDINATVLNLRLRVVHYRLGREVLRLLAVLIGRAKRHADLIMPVYTHYQAALPITYGHYLSGVALALLRDLRAIEDAARDLDRCALGAGAAGGTAVPIDSERTARLLGFTQGVRHSVDAVASRDVVLRLLASASVLGVTLSRLATDLQIWSTAEFDLIEFPDELVGSSSMLPQKRNPFVLEHIKGRAGSPVGAFTAAAIAMQATPFSNSIAVGTEAVKPLWHALETIIEATVLARLVVAGARPRSDRMRRCAVDGFTSATELANSLVRESGLSFRQAHRRVGELVSRASLNRSEPATDTVWPDPSEVVQRAAYGGGPAPASFERAIAELTRGWSEIARPLRERSRRWRDAAGALDRAVAGVRAGQSAPSVRTPMAVGAER